MTNDELRKLIPDWINSGCKIIKTIGWNKI